MFRGMKYIYEVWACGSFSLAAKKLFISQSALSNSVKRVEDHLGAQIFDRSSSPIQLTDIGKNYIHAAEQIMSIENNFTQYLTEIQNLQTGHMTIGCSSMISSFILPEILAAYKKAYPYIEITVVEGTVSELKTQLTEGLLDLVLDDNIFLPSLFDKKTYCKEYLVLAVPSRWELNNSLLAWQQSIENIISGKFLHPYYPPVPITKFNNCPFLLMQTGNDLNKRISSFCAAVGFSPTVILSVAQQLTAYNMACAGLGATFVSDTLIKKAPPNHNVIYYKIAGPEVEREICFYYKKNRLLTKCINAFLEMAE
ncbi:MAG: LysR family transcriptional regulator [Acidaminococcaceae bacterium]|nr:LysR family transcriptional regulator [Acidaminococcaceae bacterium]